MLKALDMWEIAVSQKSHNTYCDRFYNYLFKMPFKDRYEFLMLLEMEGIENKEHFLKYLQDFFKK